MSGATTRPERRSAARPSRPGGAGDTGTLSASGGQRHEFTGTGALLRVQLRRHRIRLLAWIAPLVALFAIAVPTYAELYPDLESRAVLLEQLRGDATSRIMYGWLPEPGSLGQLAQWELGTYGLILGAIMTLLLAVAAGRGQEDDGLEEVVRASGVGRMAPVGAALAVVTFASFVLGAAVAAVLALQAHSYDEVTLTGAVALGATITVVVAAFGVVTLLLGEVCADASRTRRFAFCVLAAAFAVRAVADSADESGAREVLRHLSPLGWRDVIAPFTDDRFWVAGVLALVVTALAALLPLVRSRREYGAGLLPERVRTSRGARIRGLHGLVWRTRGPSTVRWAVGLVALGAFFGALSSAMETILEDDPVIAEMMTEFYGTVDAAALYAETIVVLLGIIAACFATQVVLGILGDERRGLLELELSTGPRRWAPLAARCGFVLWTSAGVLLLAGLAMAVLVREQIGGDDTVAIVLGYAAQQVPAVLACAGVAAALVGSAPRWAAAAWLVPAFGAVNALLGEALRIPSWAGTLSVFGHGVDLTAEGGDAIVPTLVLLSVWLGGTALGLARMRRQDV